MDRDDDTGKANLELPWRGIIPLKTNFCQVPCTS
jgi:hypothetical protein